MKRLLNGFLSVTISRKSNYSTSSTCSQLCRSYMYVPGDKSKMMDKIVSFKSFESPDIIVLDLEDAVDLKHKDTARNNIYSFFESDKLKSNGDLSVCVRTNSMSFKDMLEKDLDLIAECLKVSNYEFPKMVNLPKVENINDLLWLDETFKKKIEISKLRGPIQLGIMIESCLAISRLNELCHNFTTTNFSCFLLNHAVLGSDDYCASMGITRSPSNTEVLYARQHFVNVMKAYRILPIDMVEIDIHNLEALDKNCKVGANLGFVGKQVIHPKQLPTVNKCFSPTDERIKFATELLKEYETQKSQSVGCFVFQGRMIDLPSILSAQHVVQINDQINKRQTP